jgi:hypothetical protein
MSGVDLAPNVLSQHWIAGTGLNVFQFDFGSKVDVTQCMENFSHHGIEAWRVHAIGPMGHVVHSFLSLLLLLCPRDAGVNLD